MPKFLSLNEVFFKCSCEGKFIVLEGVDFEKIRSSLSISEGDISSADLRDEITDKLS